MLFSVGSLHDKSRLQATGGRRVAYFFFSPRQPLHSINHMLYSGTLEFMTFFFLGDFLQRPAYYAAYLSNVYASLRLLTFFQDKEDSALLTPPLLR